MDSLPNRSWQLFPYPFFREFRQQNQAFSEVAAVSSILFGTHGRVAGGAKLQKIDAELVSGTYFNTLGVTPILGRVLTDTAPALKSSHLLELRPRGHHDWPVTPATQKLMASVLEAGTSPRPGLPAGLVRQASNHSDHDGTRTFAHQISICSRSSFQSNRPWDGILSALLH